MNIFRLAGDMTHLASVLVLLLKIHTIKSCAGVSLKTQELYAIVFATRYLDIFTSFVSIYNTSMKLVFLGSSFSIVWYMRYHKAVHRTYDREQDTFRHWFLVLPCLLLALLIHEKFTFLEVLWTFSLYLEAVAILPQLVLLQRTRFYVDNIPIRVYKNDKGVSYPSKPMQVEASLWNGDDWATDGGRTKVNWSYSPFIAHFQDFSLSGCNIDGLSNNVGACESSNYWWNAGKYQRLSGYEQNMYEHVRKKYMNYDYCTDRSKYQTPPRECY